MSTEIIIILLKKKPLQKFKIRVVPEDVDRKLYELIYLRKVLKCLIIQTSKFLMKS
jgi:hypothetical protein